MQIKNRQQTLAIVAIAAVTLLVGDKIIFPALTSAWKSRSTQIAALRKQVSEGKLLVQREDNLRRRWQEMRTNTLPSNPSLAEQQVLKSFDAWSQESRISIMSITPQWRVDATNYMTLQCRVEAAGNLATVSQFLYDVEHDPMALKLESVELSTRDKDGQQLSLGLQLSGLVLTPKTQ